MVAATSSEAFLLYLFVFLPVGSYNVVDNFFYKTVEIEINWPRTKKYSVRVLGDH